MDTDDTDIVWLNRYTCESCGTHWTDEWSCKCNDRCPRCDAEIEPHSSQWIGPEGQDPTPRCPLTKLEGRHAGWFLSFATIDLSYGGPEEGGWYFQTTTLVRISKIYRSEDAAWTAARRASDLIECLINKDKRPLSSVAYSGDRIIAQVTLGVPPAYTPQNRPTYL